MRGKRKEQAREYFSISSAAAPAHEITTRSLVSKGAKLTVSYSPEPLQSPVWAMSRRYKPPAPYTDGILRFLGVKRYVYLIV